MNDLEEIVYKHALVNAAKHKGNANPGAVIGSIMSQEPELRKRGKEYEKNRIVFTISVCLNNCFWL